MKFSMVITISGICDKEFYKKTRHLNKCLKHMFDTDNIMNTQSRNSRPKQRIVAQTPTHKPHLYSVILKWPPHTSSLKKRDTLNIEYPNTALEVFMEQTSELLYVRITLCTDYFLFSLDPGPLTITIKFLPILTYLKTDEIENIWHNFELRCKN